MKHICKVVYFDENSVTDYVQIVAGGKLEKTTELLNESNALAGVKGQAEVKAGIGGVVFGLLGLKASATAETEGESNFSTSKMAKNIVKNTILTDFLSVIEADTNSPIVKFDEYEISAPKDSMSYVALISPYLSMLKGGKGIPAGDYDIAIDKLDNTIKSAKGYYEFVGSKDDKQVIFRFNINSFRNNYKAPDLMKMDISIYAIRVGSSTISKLNFSNEFEIEETNTKKDNPEYDGKHKRNDDNKNDEVKLNVYDVLLAGVEIDDK